MGIRLFGLLLAFLGLATLRSAATDNTYVRFETILGNIDVQLLTDEAPNTVANFMVYVNSGAYNSSLIHRSIPGFVIQGGSFSLSGNSINTITANAAIASEAGNSNHASNVQGTLSMALLAGVGIDSPDSATDGWFFNLVDNTFLDTAQSETDPTSGQPYTSGPFTVFGRVANTSSMAVMEALGNLPTFDFSSLLGSPFTNLPVFNYMNGNSLMANNLVLVNSIVPLSVQGFAAWQSANFTTAQVQANDPTVVGPFATPAGDGVTNIEKYLYNFKTPPGTPASAADRANMPVAGVSNGNVTLTYHANPALLDVGVASQTSPDMQTWSTGPTPIQTGTDSNGNAIMQVQVPESGTKQFIRLVLTPGGA